MDPKTRWLFLFLQAAPCAYHCKHCDFDATANFQLTPIERLKAFTQPFIEARDAGNAYYAHLAAHLGDCGLNHPDLSVWVTYLKQYDIEGWQSLPADGIRSRPSEQWRPYLDALHQAGTKYLEFSLYGLAETHDGFAGSPGSYASLFALADLWQQIGGQTSWFAFLHKHNLGEIAALEEQIAAQYATEMNLTTWNYQGRAVNIEDLRLERADLAQLSPGIQTRLEHLKTEHEWCELLEDDESLPFPSEPQVIRLAVDPAGIARIPYTNASAGLDGPICGQLPPSSLSSFLDGWKELHQAWSEAYPPTWMICQTFSDRSSERLYDQSSILRKWASFYEAKQGKVKMPE